MEPSIPIPTDNVYKFAALFGLVVFISGMLGIAYLGGRYNDLLFKNILELETLKVKDKDKLSKEEEIKISGLE